MKIKKAVLIEPKFPWFNLFSYARIPLLGLPILGSILKKMGIDVIIFCENIASIDWNMVKKTDIVGITALTSLVPRAYKLINKIKKVNSRCKIIMGGVHVTFRPEEALEHGADFVVRNEGEKTLKELIECLENNSNPKKIKGLSFKKNGKYYHNPDRNEPQNLNNIPAPDFSLIKKFRKLNYIPIQTSRGCPHNCEFCSVVQMFGRKIRYRKSTRVIKDLKTINNTFDLNKKHVFFVDDNFSADENRTLDLLKNLKNLNIDLDWSTQEEVNVYKKKKVLDLMKKTGCSRLYLGIESFDQKVLNEYNKPQKAENIKHAIKTIHDRDILIHGMFVLGADTTTEKTIINTSRAAVDYKLDTAQFFVLVPLPGTRLFKMLKKEGRILLDSVKDWELFDGHHVVFKPKNLSPYRLQQLQIQAFKKFYNLKNSLNWLIRKKYKNFTSTIYGTWAIRKWIYRKKGYLKQLKSNYHSTIPK
ncbi:MAG: B12-binding domain-containing radical SAM protein [Bacillota bacterium]